MVNEPSVFKPLKFYCSYISCTLSANIVMVQLISLYRQIDAIIMPVNPKMSEDDSSLSPSCKKLVLG